MGIIKALARTYYAMQEPSRLSKTAVFDAYNARKYWPELVRKLTRPEESGLQLTPGERCSDLLLEFAQANIAVNPRRLVLLEQIIIMAETGDFVYAKTKATGERIVFP
ncbi:hypothetical protein [Paracraurococcus lichenis]|uniref:Uncharacterized protein n=1 Tax=Paracraurococcus lichenis TaxID=3064888 RepID=A0ABT9E735_9PROT|nr:hypothetical protein [Paracraurococcus sp. LOR1-02]MDO9711978.1 hypothetical protein [Paracraurococcus sp. LOR1-02]